MRVLLLDNYDSFTYNLFDYLEQTGVACTVVRNDAAALDDMLQLDFQAVVLSPGPGRPCDAGLMPELITRLYAQKPILGVCLGMQALGEFFGAHLVKAQQPMHGKTSMVRHTGHPLFAGLPAQFEVMRYHSLVLESLADTALECTASTESGEIMALTHRSLPLSGVQFHPESVLTQFGLEMIRNWVTLAQQSIMLHANTA